MFQFIELPRDVYASHFESFEDESRFDVRDLVDVRPGERVMVVPQGGATAGAEEGVKALAAEIQDFWSDFTRSAAAGGGSGGELSLAVVLPAGTGTTAYYLAKHLCGGEAGETNSQAPVRVFAIPCCGEGAYLRQQMGRLEGKKVGDWPVVLEGSTKSTFAKPEAHLYETWDGMRGDGLLADLIYAPYAWQVMLEHEKTLWGGHSHVLYVHTGGLEGLASQLARYQHLGLILNDEGDSSSEP